MQTDQLRGKSALVTGASKGIGKAIVLALAQTGADVILVARNRAQLNDTAEAARALGVKTAVHVADLTNEADVAALAGAVGAPHILVNNAGVNVRKPLEELTAADWRQVLDTNLTSVFLLCHHFAPRMKGRAYGRIINIASTMAHVAIPGRVAYCASKAGVLGFTRALALELAPEKITVNSISPGPFATEMNAPLMQNLDLNRQFLSKIPAGRWGDPDDIGQLVVHLCSEHAAFITGADILIDGGWTAQ